MARIKGKRQWKSVIAIIDETIEENVSFISNGKEYTALRLIPQYHYITTDTAKAVTSILYMSNSGTDFFQSVNHSGILPVLVVDEDFRIMDFGDNGQEISDTLYSFIINNTTLLVDNVVDITKNYIVSGQLLADIGNAMRQCGVEDPIALSDLPNVILSVMGHNT